MGRDGGGGRCALGRPTSPAASRLPCAARDSAVRANSLRCAPPQTRAALFRPPLRCSAVPPRPAQGTPPPPLRRRGCIGVGEDSDRSHTPAPGRRRGRAIPPAPLRSAALRRKKAARGASEASSARTPPSEHRKGARRAGAVGSHGPHRLPGAPPTPTNKDKQQSGFPTDLHRGLHRLLHRQRQHHMPLRERASTGPAPRPCACPASPPLPAAPQPRRARPPSPPSGPRSISQSASAMTSRSCSITTTLWPPLTSRCSTWISFDVGHVQAHRRLVEHVERVRRLVAAPRDVVAHLAELGHQLDALRLAARQRRRRLAQRQVAEPDVPQQLQRMADVGHRGEERDRFVDLHLQHVADALAAPAPPPASRG